jgi:DNA polymerase I-like protein with 3'-5' exonuclease and polymerase domains
MTGKPIEVDCETTGLQPWSGKQEAFLWTFYDGEKKEALYPQKPEDRAKIQAWFDRGKTEGMRAWNTKFDRGFADAQGYDLPPDGMWHDGMLVAHAIDERRSVALKAVADSLWPGADDLQKEVKGWLTHERARRKKQAQEDGTELVEPNYSDVPIEIMEPYALEDVILTRKVCDHYDTVLDQKPELKRVVEFEREVMDALYAIEKRGLPASQTDYRRLEQEVVDNLEGLEERVQTLVAEGDRGVYLKALGKEVEVSEDGKVIGWDGTDAEFNPASSAQVIAALKSRGANMKFMATKDGEIKSADAENLGACDDELATAILDFRTELKVLSTYVRPMIDRSYVRAMRHWKEPFIAPDGRIHATYRQVGARTGRMSCSDPNMQNQPRDDLRLRYNIVADPGYKLVACDLSNIEMVLFAAYCGEGKLLEAVQKGEDLHTLTAKMLGFRDRARSGGTFETARQQGKTYNFSRVYGGGHRTIMRQRRCDMAEARLLKKRFDDAYPEVVKLTERIEWRLHDQGYIADGLISGRRFRVDPRDAYKATNYLVQGTAAALLKWAVVQLHKDGVPMVALVHDEVVAHVPEADAEDAKRLIIQRMTEHPGLQGVVPLSAEGDIVDRWSQAKDPLWVPNWAKEAA